MEELNIQKQFAEEGYVLVENVLDPERDLQPVIDDYTALLDELARRWYAEGKIPSAYADLPFNQRATQVISQISDEEAYYLDISLPKAAVYTEETPVYTSDATFKLLTNPRLLDTVEMLIGSEIYSNPIQHARIKPPEFANVGAKARNTYLEATPWHQDQGVITADADSTDILSVWIPIVDATVENGCLAIIPGSHGQGLAPHCFEIPERFRDMNVTPMPMKAGSILMFHRLIKHCSLPNLSNDIRFSFDLRYSPIGQPTGRENFPGFVARSRQHPESVLPHHHAWAKLWQDARSKLAAQGESPFPSRWNGVKQPECA
jgi:phytanoyl-CoA hydroxylase